MAATNEAEGWVTPKEAEARSAWALLSQQPLTEASFVEWYVASGAHATAKKRASADAPPAKPPAKRQALLPTQGAPAPLGKGKRNALLKAVTNSLKAAIKGKKTKWHSGDRNVMAGSSVMDAADFAALFPSVAMVQKGVVTSFPLSGDELAVLFGDVKLSVPTWTQSMRAFEKAHKTGSADVALAHAEGKYSSGTSTLTIKFSLVVSGDAYHEDANTAPLFPR
ncbi:hypothetical protein M885DRAFT_563868 [Pelagophyceae sp. CCMP2097]|nr:hypothetical protein M885DRAFT_563868 [Pelagophyceae sp. CCMP2097]